MSGRHASEKWRSATSADRARLARQGPLTATAGAIQVKRGRANRIKFCVAVTRIRGCGSQGSLVTVNHKTIAIHSGHSGSGRPGCVFGLLSPRSRSNSSIWLHLCVFGCWERVLGASAAASPSRLTQWGVMSCASLYSSYGEETRCRNYETAMEPQVHSLV